MPLIKYMTYITYPDGTPAASVTLPVWLLGGNQPTQLFSDKAGTSPLANPITTDAEGLAAFYAAPGPHTAELAGQVFPFLVDPLEPDAAWPNTYVHTQTVAATVWTVDHWFGIKPAITIDVANAQVETQIMHPTVNQTVLTFSVAVSGAAYLRR